MHWVTAASALLAFLLYYNTLDAGFVYDDRRAIITNPDVVGNNPAKALFENDFWGTPLTDGGSHGSYRPLCVATYRLNYALSELKPWSYHFINVLLHCSATLLVVITAKCLLPRSCAKVGVVVTGLTFAAHPIHTEAVAAIVGRADLAACNLFLLSFLLYNEHLKLRDQSNPCHKNPQRDDIVLNRSTLSNDQTFRFSCHGLIQHIFSSFRKLPKTGGMRPIKLTSGKNASYSVKPKTSKVIQCECNASVSIVSEMLQWITLAGTLLLAVAATLCKEPGITVIPLCILYDVFRGALQTTTPKNRWRSVYVMGAGGFTLLYWRLRLEGTPPAFASADNPAARDPSILTRTLTFAYLPVFNFYLLLYPFQLSFDWGMDAIPRITTLIDPRNIVTAIFYTTLSRVAWKAFKNEFKEKLAERKEIKNLKNRGNVKSRFKPNCRQPPKVCTDKGDRRGYHVPCKDSGTKKQICSCLCKNPLSDEHTRACRLAHNNNYTYHSWMCGVSGAQNRMKSPVVYTNPRVALLIFVAFMTLPFVPASNALFYVGFVVAERVVYLPSVGFCMLVGLGAGVATRGLKRGHWRSQVLMCSFLMLLLAMCGRTITRNLDWRDEESLFRSALHINPPKAYGNLGSVLSAQGRTKEAEVAFERALIHRPNMADVHYNLGISLQNRQQYEGAIKSFQRAIYFRPSMALAYVNLGVSLAARGRLPEAMSVLQAGTRVDGAQVRDRRQHDTARVSAFIQLAALYIQTHHLNKALTAYRQALQIIPDVDAPVMGWTRQRVLAMARETHAQIKNWSLAERTALDALAAAPTDVAAHLAYAKLLVKDASRNSEAEQWFKKAISLAPSDHTIRSEFAEFLRSQQRPRDVAEQLVAAAELAPMDPERALAAAHALKDAKESHSAEQWYARTAELSPEDPRSHANLGAILYINGKYAAAVDSYQRALQLRPEDKRTLTNLKRVTKLMKKQK